MCPERGETRVDNSRIFLFTTTLGDRATSSEAHFSQKVTVLDRFLRKLITLEIHLSRAGNG